MSLYCDHCLYFFQIPKRMPDNSSLVLNSFGLLGANKPIKLENIHTRPWLIKVPLTRASYLFFSTTRPTIQRLNSSCIYKVTYYLSGNTCNDIKFCRHFENRPLQSHEINASFSLQISNGEVIELWGKVQRWSEFEYILCLVYMEKRVMSQAEGSFARPTAHWTRQLYTHFLSKRGDSFTWETNVTVGSLEGWLA